MSDAQFNPIWELQIFSKSQNYVYRNFVIENGKKKFLWKALSVDIECTYPSLNAMPEASFTLYNLDLTRTKDMLENAKQVIISAGFSSSYTDDGASSGLYGRIFDGMIMFPEASMVTNTSSFTSRCYQNITSRKNEGGTGIDILKLDDGQKKLTYPIGTKQDEAKIKNRFNQGKEILGISSNNNFYKIDLNNNAINYYIGQNNGLIGSPKAIFANKQIPVFTTSEPFRAVFGVTITSTLLPEVKFGDTINLSSLFYSGTYKVTSYKHNISTSSSGNLIATTTLETVSMENLSGGDVIRIEK